MCVWSRFCKRGRQKTAVTLSLNNRWPKTKQYRVSRASDIRVLTRALSDKKNCVRFVVVVEEKGDHWRGQSNVASAFSTSPSRRLPPLNDVPSTLTPLGEQRHIFISLFRRIHCLAPVSGCTIYCSSVYEHCSFVYALLNTYVALLLSQRRPVLRTTLESFTKPYKQF